MSYIDILGMGSEDNEFLISNSFQICCGGLLMELRKEGNN